MKAVKNYKFWFCTGSQDLYGDECLKKVAKHSQIIVEELNKSGVLPFEVVWKPTLITNELIRKTFNEANTDEECAGVITWMHTFSPAKSWILGLQEYRKPLLHLHTQFNEEIPYDTIDMDFMNENQAAHGDREYGHIVSRMGIERKVVMGHWSDRKVQERIASWMRTAIGVIESSHVRVMRVADNMRNVAVTEGDKVEAQLKFGWEVDTYPVNEIAEAVGAVSESDTNALVDEYYDKYWNRIEVCTKYDVSAFIRDYLSVKQQAIPQQSKIYINFKDYVELGNIQTEPLLMEMLAYAKRYQILLDGKTGNAALNACIFRLNRLETTVTRPFFLEVLRLYDESKLSMEQVTEIFLTAENYLFRRSICDLPTNALNKIFLMLHREIMRYDGTETDYVEKFKYALLSKKERARFPDDEEFAESFISKPVYLMNSKNKVYILERLENFGTDRKSVV